MTVSRDEAIAVPAGPGDPGGEAGRAGRADQVGPGLMPAPADCFVPRPQSGPGELAAAPPDKQCLVLTDAPARDPRQGLLGGTGKTQLAAHLARTWLAENPDGMLVWLDAARRDSLLSGYAQAAQAAQTAQTAQAAQATSRAGSQADTAAADTAELIASRFLKGLARADSPWLVVMDGLTDPAEAEDLWPSGPSGRVLVTAEQGTTVPASLRPLVFGVGPLSSHEALTYLMARLSADPDQRHGAVDLVEELGYHPLALVQASAAIASAEISCRDYRDVYIKRREQIAAASGTAPAAAAVTWILSVECADELTPGGAPQVCLALAALLGSAGIPLPVFATRAVADFAARSPGGTDGPGRVRAALASLQSAGLLHVDAGLVFLQKAVRAAVLAATPASLRTEAAVAAASALLEAWPEDAGDDPLACTLRGCAASLQQAASDALWAGTGYRVMFRAGQSLDAARITGPAHRHWRAVAAASERWLGPAHEDAQLATHRLAAAALTAGAGSAAALYQRLLDTQVRHRGPDHPRTVAARAEFGTALLAVGQPDDAITILEGVLAACDRPGGVDGVDALAVQSSLGDAYQAAGRHKDAIGVIERTLAERERRQGPDHPEAIRTRVRLARAWLDGGHAKNAIKHGTRALQGAERVLGPDSPDTVDAVTVLASAQHAARRVRDAIMLYERALADRERIQGPDHPETIGVRGNLASAYHSAGRLPSALELYERTRADCQRVLGDGHPDTLAARANLAHAYYAMGRLSDARALLTATLADCERLLVPGDPLTAAVRESLAAMARA